MFHRIAGRLSRIGTAARKNTGTGLVDIPTNAILPLDGFISGFVPSNNGVDPTNDLDFTAGVVWDDAGTGPIRLAAATRAIDAVFAEGGPGYRSSLDNLAGAKTFHVFAIAGEGKNDDLFASTLLSPTLPTGFTRKQRVFSFLWSGSAITPFSAIQLAGGALDVLWVDPVADFAAAAPSVSEVLQAMTVPTGIPVIGKFSFTLWDTSSSTDIYVLASSPDQNDTAPSSSLNTVSTQNYATGEGPNSASKDIRTDTSGRIRYRGSGTTTNATLAGMTDGWADLRGVNA